MKNMRFNIVILFLFCFITSNAQIYKTEPVSDEIHTIQVNRNGEWYDYPVIDLGKGDFVRLNFDRISDDSFNRLRYKLIYCNADWSKSNLYDIEYLDGFNDNVISDYASSVNTTVGYTNFMVDIPNDDVRFKLSGNYAIQVYEEDNPDNILLNACFSVLDSQVAIGGSMSSNTLIDANREHQQVSFTINHPSVRINDPFSELKVYVRQNNRVDNQKIDVKPAYVQPNRLIYEQKRDLIFEAGNEFRRFDIPSSRYNGLRIMQMVYERPYYYASIVPDIFRAYTRYIYDEDQNGRFMIRNTDGSDNDTDSDYFFVNFTLQTERPFLEKVYIYGDFMNDIFDEKYQMQYDYEKQEYYSTILLKQGSYNYMYVLDKGGKFNASDIEGNYYETENSYQVLVYHRPPGQQYDALIGYLNIGK